METWKEIISKQIKSAVPKLNPGDQVEVHYRVVEGEKERIQIFSGTVIKIRGAESDATFTVRKIASGGVGVERIFPFYSPLIADVRVLKGGRVRRAKLYYLRGLKGKAARLREKTVNQS